MNIPERMREIEREVGKLSPVHKILLGTDGSVTRMLEIITGHPVAVVTRSQEVVHADKPTADLLAVEEGEPINHRVVELRDAESNDVLVYAVSDTPISRLPSTFRHDLMKADVPIGTIMQNHRIEARREILDARVLAADPDLGAVFGIYRDEPLLNRRYQIIHHEQPLIAIEETFPYHLFDDERRVIITAPSRIHLGLIDMNGASGRVDGGIGIALKEPGILIEVQQGEGIEIHGGDEDCRQAVRRAAERMHEAMCIPACAEITLRRTYPRHIGLGSGTQLALATASAIAELHGRRFPVGELARIVGRGGTSGIGTAAFERGGFIVDGGHTFGNHGEKTQFSPSSASRGLRPAPVTVQHPFPEEWRILLAIPALPPGASAVKEMDIFRDHCPVPIEEVRELSHEILMRMLPALVERDLDAFGAGVNHLQHLGFKRVELSLQPPAVHHLLGVMRDAGAAGAGMSSFGPALYAVGDTGMRAVESAVKASLAEMGGGETLITTANNAGALQRVP
jgi:beta-ribofuranosylaminobenzene 5'-phosphate synthase